MAIKIERTTYRQFGNCLRISNDVAELYVTLDFGPRVIHYSLLGNKNIMFTNDQRINIKQGAEFDRAFYPGAYWNIYGGNRVWVSPEVMPDTFYPDHDPVEYEVVGNGATFYCKPQLNNQVQISVRVMLDEATSRVKLSYQVKNVGQAPKVMAAWSVTAVAGGGLEIIPQPTTLKGVLPNRLISLWDYSDMSDPRIYWGKRYVAISHNPAIAQPVKIGINNVDGWACYVNQGQCFVCRFRHEQDADYHDFGASYESYVNGDYLEMESVGPLKEIPVGHAAIHHETWELLTVEDILLQNTEEALAAFVTKYISPSL